MASGAMVWFSCCITQRPPSKRRPRIDRSMIGLPTDFRHTGHIGSNDLTSNNESVNTIQGQMQSKGGYDHISPVDITLNHIDLSELNKTT